MYTNYTHLHNQDTRHTFVLIDWPNVFFPILYSFPATSLLHFLFFITSIGFNLFCVKKNTPFFPFSLSSLAFFSHVGSIRVDILLSVLSLAFFFFFVVELEIPTLIGLLKLFSLEIYYLFGCGKFFFTHFFFFFFTQTFINISTRETTKKRHKCPTTAASRARSREDVQERESFFVLIYFFQQLFFFFHLTRL